MKNFFTSALGSLFAILLLLAVGAGLGSCAASRKSKIRGHSWLLIEMHEDLLEYDPPGGVLTEITSGDVETLQRILDNLDKARVDERIDGVIFRISAGSAAGRAKTQEIRGAVSRVRRAGKKVLCWAESFDARDYLLLAACDEVLAMPSAYVDFTGFASSSVHVKRALDKLGIRPNLHKLREYKSAAELVTREDMSDEARENLEWMLDEMWDMFVEALEQDRKLSEERITELMQHAFFTADEARERGLIDRLLYWDELEQELERTDDDELRTVSQERYAKVPPRKLGLAGDRTIAVVHAQGMIFGRTSGVNPLIGLTMGHETVVAELRRARRDDDVAAIVFRVDSRGGDALASDLISREVDITAKVKPVVVSMVDVAASGGYDIAYRGTKIVADPLTVTGSIGSISGKFNMAGLYEKLGITHDSVTRGPMALADSELRDYTPEERERFEAYHTRSFNAWLEDVARRRGMAFEQLELLAYGRVWTGRQARDNGLIDELGDLDRAVALAKELAGIPADRQVTLAHYPEKKGLVRSVLGGDDAATVAARFWVHRALRREIADTVEILRLDPAARALAP
jgi:protease-4